MRIIQALGSCPSTKTTHLACWDKLPSHEAAYPGILLPLPTQHWMWAPLFSFGSSHFEENVLWTVPEKCLISLDISKRFKEVSGSVPFYSLHCPSRSPSGRILVHVPLTSHHVGTLKVLGPLGLGIHSSKKDEVLEKDTSVRRSRGTIDTSC